MNLSDLIARNAAFTPDKPAIIFDGEALSYRAFHHRIEAAASQHGAHARKIFGESGKHAEPVLAIINFQAFERSQPLVGLDDL